MFRLLIVFLFVVSYTCTKAATADSSLLVGRWKGTSLCQVKPSPCHDEVVVFYITATGQPNGYSIRATKIVNGEEEEMGILPAVYDPSKHKLVSVMAAGHTWSFTLKNLVMDGTLTLSNGVLYRIVHVEKQ